MSFFATLLDTACVLEEDIGDSIQMQMFQADVLFYLMIFKDCVMDEGIIFVERVLWS